MIQEQIPAVLVTGAGRGLGKGVALELASAGFHVAIHYAGNRTTAEATAAECVKLAVSPDQKFPLIQGNIALAADRKRLFEETVWHFGRLDALVNNAGMAPRVRADITEAGEESFDELISVNLKGPYFLSQLAAQHWLEHPGQSRIASGYKLLFVTSISASIASTNRGDYCISKAGLAMASLLWASRLAEHGIQVVELRPGIMETDMTSGVKEKYDALIASGLVPQRRWGQPQDVGAAVKSILQGHFPFTTGDVIYLDGGIHMKTL